LSSSTNASSSSFGSSEYEVVFLEDDLPWVTAAGLVFDFVGVDFEVLDLLLEAK